MSQDVVLEVLREEHLSQMADICRDGFGSKRFMGCCAMSESAEKMKKRYSKYPRERWELCVVAVEGTTVLGFCQLSKQGLPTWPEGLHTCKAGEMYVELVAVGASARGKGVGGKLLEWCDEKAKNTPGITNLTLEVVGGNRAIGLYERRGYETIPQDPVDKCCTAMFVCCIFGRPYGCCDSGWGSMTMVKPMESAGCNEMQRVRASVFQLKAEMKNVGVSIRVQMTGLQTHARAQAQQQILRGGRSSARGGGARRGGRGKPLARATPWMSRLLWRTTKRVYDSMTGSGVRRGRAYVWQSIDSP